MLHIVQRMVAGLQLLGFQEPKIDDLPTEKLKASEAHISGQIKIEREPVAISDNSAI